MTVTAPATSKRSLLERSPASTARKTAASAMRRTPIGTLMRKTQRQPAPSVSRPLAITPTDAETPATAPKSPERAIAFGAFRESHREDREHGRRYERRPEPLQGPGTDQELG